MKSMDMIAIYPEDCVSWVNFRPTPPSVMISDADSLVSGGVPEHVPVSLFCLHVSSMIGGCHMLELLTRGWTVSPQKNLIIPIKAFYSPKVRYHRSFAEVLA